MFDSYESHVLQRSLERLAKENYPETWEDHAYIANAADVILSNGYRRLDQVPADLRVEILVGNGITPAGDQYV